MGIGKEMNKYLIYMLFFMIAVKGLSQDENKDIFSFGAGYFYGNIYEHNPDISHLIKGHPTGLFLMFNKIPKTVIVQSPPLLVAFTSMFLLQ